MISSILYKHSGRIPFIIEPIFPTIKYYINIHGRQKSLWADVWFTSYNQQYHNNGAFILVSIPENLNGTYCLMPLCNSQERIQVKGDIAVQKFICK